MQVKSQHIDITAGLCTLFKLSHEVVVTVEVVWLHQCFTLCYTQISKCDLLYIFQWQSQTELLTHNYKLIH